MELIYEKNNQKRKIKKISWYCPFYLGQLRKCPACQILGSSFEWSDNIEPNVQQRQQCCLYLISNDTGPSYSNIHRPCKASLLILAQLGASPSPKFRIRLSFLFSLTDLEEHHRVWSHALPLRLISSWAEFSVSHAKQLSSTPLLSRSADLNPPLFQLAELQALHLLLAEEKPL